MGEVPPGCVKLEFSFGAHGIDLKGDEVSSVIDGTQAANKGVKKGWKLVMIDGVPMDDDNLIRPTLQKKSKAGKKYTVVFSKTTDEMKADMASADAAEAARKKKMLEDEAKRKADAADKAAKEQAKKDEVDARKKAYADKQKVASTSQAPAGIVIPPPKRKDGSSSNHSNNSQLQPGENEVIIKYVNYAECFTLIDGCKLTQQDIDDVYSLSSVMPGCFLHLSVREFKHDEEHVYIKEEPKGVWATLTPKMTYYLYIQQDPVQYEEDMKRCREVWAGAAKGEKPPRTKEGCSCIWGNPCLDDSTCLDWPNRFAVAIAHGGNPILFQQ